MAENTKVSRMKEKRAKTQKVPNVREKGVTPTTWKFVSRGNFSILLSPQVIIFCHGQNPKLKVH
jgi:hypothetical protein